jgi:3-deoxy-D-manno-octulosonic-acid transferase
MRGLYSWLVRFAAPLAFAVVLWRGLRDRQYWQGLPERFGFGGAVRGSATSAGAFTLWLHAVSLGEMTAAAPLVRALLARYSHGRMLLTTATPAGRACAQALFGALADVRYLPYDTPGAMRRFIARTRPRIAIIMETELWPNLFGECARAGIPVVLGSARVTSKSARRYGGFGGLFRSLFDSNVTVAAQTADDARRFESIGAAPRSTHVVGNVKFDLDIDARSVDAGRALRRALQPARNAWVAGSTHAGEDEMVLDAHATLLETRPDTLLLLVPRHKDRFDAVADLLSRRRFRFARRSHGETPLADTQVLLGDTLGELMSFYAAADVAFVGGSLVPVGGHNLLEPAALGIPVLTGPYTDNSREIVALMLERGAAQRVADAAELAGALAALLSDREAALRAGALGQEIVAANRGSVARLLGLIEPVLAAAHRGAAH